LASLGEIGGGETLVIVPENVKDCPCAVVQRTDNNVMANRRGGNTSLFIDGSCHCIRVDVQGDL